MGISDEIISDLRQKRQQAYDGVEFLQKNIIARITPNKEIEPIKVLFQNDFGLVSPPREYFGPINIQILNIQLLDEYGRIVDLNNMNYNFCLSLITIYDL